MAPERTRTRPSQYRTDQFCATEWVQDNPFTSTTVLFGVGVVVGLLIGHTVAEASGRRLFHEESWKERLTGHIRDAVIKNLPQTISRHLS